MKRNLLIVFLIACGCLQAQRKETSELSSAQTNTLDPQIFKDKLKADPNIVLLDVRTAAEAAEGIIPGAVVMDFNGPDFIKKAAFQAAFFIGVFSSREWVIR